MPLPSQSITNRLRNGLAGFLLTLSCLITAFWISWHALAQVNFGYSMGYDLLDMAHIQRFGPTNQYRHGFEQTSRHQHMTLFAEIVDAIQHGGKGLGDIRYFAGNHSDRLLRKPEVVHLQDVANLITLFNQVAMASVVLLVMLVLLYRRLGWQPPTAKRILLGSAITLAVAGLFLLIVGPTQTFYWLHTKVFPDDHQWFFYYQESLMTTLMKAPDLFGFIAALWGLAALVLFGLGQWLLHRALNARAPNTRALNAQR